MKVSPMTAIQKGFLRVALRRSDQVAVQLAKVDFRNANEHTFRIVTAITRWTLPGVAQPEKKGRAATGLRSPSIVHSLHRATLPQPGIRMMQSYLPNMSSRSRKRR